MGVETAADCSSAALEGPVLGRVNTLSADALREIQTDGRRTLLYLAVDRIEAVEVPRAFGRQESPAEIPTPVEGIRRDKTIIR
jgi:hypothetical protein